MKMLLTNGKQYVFTLLIITFSAFILLFHTSCGNQSNTQNSDSSDTGSITFEIVRANSAPRSQKAITRATVDCVAEQISKIRVYVYGPDNALLKSSALWDCDAHKGIIEKVPAGANRRVVIIAIGLDQKVVLCGEQDGIRVIAGQTSTIDSIELTEFTPSLSEPFNGSQTISLSDLLFRWNRVIGAQYYSIEISDNQNFNSPTKIDNIITNSYLLSAILPSGTNHWRVKAYDEQGNEGRWSDTWTFALSRPDLTLKDSADNEISFGGTLDLGTVNVYSSVEAIFKIRNDGTADLSISEIALISGDTTDFNIDTHGMDTTVAPTHETQFKVTFNPIIGGSKSITLCIVSDDSLEFNVSGYAVDFHGISHLDSANDVGMYSSIAVEDGKIFICYYDETDRNLKVAKSIDDGIHWSFATIASGDDVGKGSSIAVDGDYVFISTTIKKAPNETERIGISASHDGGNTWDTYPILPDNSRTSNANYDEFSTSIAVDGQHIYIAFLSYDVLFMHLLKSTYAAADWTITPIPPPPDDYENGYYASMVAHNGALYIGHSGYTEADIHCTRIPDTMSNPSTALVDQISVMGDKGYTSLAVREFATHTEIYIAYFDQSAGNHNLNFAHSINNGDNFSITTIDNQSSIVGKYPSMAIADNAILISYYDESNQNLKLAISDDNGASWEIKTVDDSTDNVGRFTSLALDGQKVYISYYDESNKDLKFAKSIDGGNTWH